jgi:uncharacterized coiled-coil DUF342 family protein
MKKMGLFKTDVSQLKKDIDNLRTTVDEQISALRVSLDKLNVQMSAQSEVRKVFNEKFAHVDETIGGIKQAGLQREKDLRKIELEVTKSTELINSVQPQKIFNTVSQMELKIQAVMNKIATFESLHEKMFDEIKDMKRVVEVFRGTEEIAKTNAEIKKDHMMMNKLFEDFKLKGDKIESIYLQIKNSETNFDAIKKEFSAGLVKLKSLEKDYASLLKTVSSSVTRAEFDEEFKKYSSMIVDMERATNKTNMKIEIVENANKELMGIRKFLMKNSLNANDIKAFAQKIRELDVPLEKYKSELESLKNSLVEKQEEVNSNVSKANDLIKTESENFKETIKSISKPLIDVRSEVKVMMSNYEKQHRDLLNRIEKIQGSLFVRMLEVKKPEEVPPELKSIYEYVQKQVIMSREKTLDDLRNKLLEANHKEEIVDFIYKYVK